MKLKQITLTGVDAHTDINRLCEIQREYPIAEFGVLVSQNWAKNGNRYLSPDKIDDLRDKGLNLSCHACGKIAREALRGNWTPVQQLTNGLAGIFNRCQLNIATADIKDEKLYTDVPMGLKEVIIQQKDADHMEIWNKIQLHYNLSVILDASGGHGIDTPVVPYDLNDTKVGYAGGMNPENVGEKLDFLLKSDIVKDFWIDMETGVRTDDWFDLDKVAKVLEVCTKVINNNK